MLKVLNFVRPQNGLTEDPLYFFHFDEYEKECGDFSLFMADFSLEIKKDEYKNKRKIVFHLEEPNFSVGDSPLADLEEYAEQILTICPYQAEVSTKRTHIFFPINERYIPVDSEKSIDICYFGSLPQSYPFAEYINKVFPQYNYIFGNYNAGNARRCSYQEKLNFIGKSRIALIHGLCNADRNAESRFRAYPNGEKIRSFDCIKTHGLMPQIKSRMFESAMCKTIMLVQKDPFNVIEYFFTPNEDFLYFENQSDLQNKIDAILANPFDYDFMVNNAYEKAINNYTVRHFVEKYLKVL